ncbi:hypothetical protein DICSQDRAFT_169151 [Dichomitus squalens LYAD-421 SS1]|uniref:uncharacterized protein n=1 Tax=Dichomitus squalens (strain LYAD-421) TaxID=732165 RepID=UPI0004413667|nr:uncharacterized protein DICSQDRAFT_169151 [Dichomitus squalens LYAD-421 SS1]EJF62759.1 hypothetical protein DICSQDRAFT_169151 [Dichomitus squalens LYAD-421 SS1]
MTPTDVAFRAELNQYRREQTLKTRGLAHLNNLGAGIIMGDDTLDRIADCARAHKLMTVETLYQEMKYYPTNTPFISTPLGPRQSEQRPGADIPQTGEHVAAAAAKTPRQCGACGQYSHIKTNLNCPARDQRSGSADKENATTLGPTSGVASEEDRLDA